MNPPKRINFVVLLLSLLSLSTLSAQEIYEGAYGSSRVFRRFKVGVGLPFTGVAIPTSAPLLEGESDHLAGGYTASFGYVEPQYAITDNFGIGLRWEFFLRFGGKIRDHEGVVDPSLKVSPSAAQAFLLYADYYFSTRKVRFSAGLGLGYFLRSSTNIQVPLGEDVSFELETGTAGAFDLAPRVRMNVGHFVVGVAYHRTFHVAAEDLFLINLGWEFGGGRLHDGYQIN